MTTFVAFPDIHDQSAHFKRMRHVLADVDVVLFVGDMTNGSMDHLQRLLNTVQPYNEHILAVCGNMDTEQMNMMLARMGISVHRRHAIIDGIAVLGVGGALPFTGDYVFSEDQLAGFLQDTLQGVPATMPKLLMAHQPPYGTRCDQIADGDSVTHVGSHAVRAFIERVQPLVCFTGHIHEAVGMDTIGRTQVINPGAIAETGAYAFLEIEGDEIITLEQRAIAELEL